MPSLERGSHRIVIAGASSLLGAELRSLLEESRFAGAEFRLVDEEVAAGLLTEAGGEPAVIQPVEEGTFGRAGKVFFTGSVEFTRATRQYRRDRLDWNARSARQSGRDRRTRSGRCNGIDWRNRCDRSNGFNRLDGSDRSTRRDRSAGSASFIPRSVFDVAHLRGRGCRFL